MYTHIYIIVEVMVNTHRTKHSLDDEAMTPCDEQLTALEVLYISQTSRGSKRSAQTNMMMRNIATRKCSSTPHFQISPTPLQNPILQHLRMAWGPNHCVL